MQHKNSDSISTSRSAGCCLVGLIASLLVLSACGVTNSTPNGSNGFGMTASRQNESVAETASSTVARVALSPATVTTGTPVSVTVELAQPAAAGGITVQLASSDPSAIALPSTLHFDEGQASASLEIQTAAAGKASQVAITANTGVSKAGANLKIASDADATATADQKLDSSEIDVSKLDASKINLVSNPNATFKGCWYKIGKNRYQSVDISVGIAGTYPFNAVLYNGAACNPADKADQFGFGDPLTLGKANYIFWFSDFKNRANMSAIWYLGSENSKCVSYATAPTC
jgi:hypothetical protein